MIWFILYCLLCIPFFLIGLNVLDLGWFWNGVFSILSSGSLTFGIIRVIRSRLCPYRVRNSIKSNKKTKYIRVIIEKAFGNKPHFCITNDVDTIISFAYIPLVILLFSFLEPVIDSVSLRVFLGLILAIPCDLVLYAIAYWAAAQKAMLKSVKGIVRNHKEEMWSEMTKFWVERSTAMKQETERSKGQIRIKKQIISSTKETKVSNPKSIYTHPKPPSLHAKDIVGIILYVHDCPNPPGGSAFAGEVFQTLNSSAFEEIKRVSIDPIVEVRNLCRGNHKAFIIDAMDRAVSELDSRFANCVLVTQDNIVGSQRTGKISIMLCTYFKSDKKTIFMLSPENSLCLKK